MDYEKKLQRFEKELLKNQTLPFHITYKVLTMKDQRVCSKCKDFHGVQRDVSEAVIGVNHPPFHKECRCIVTFEMNGLKK